MLPNFFLDKNEGKKVFLGFFVVCLVTSWCQMITFIQSKQLQFTKKGEMHTIGMEVCRKGILPGLGGRKGFWHVK